MGVCERVDKMNSVKQRSYWDVAFTMAFCIFLFHKANLFVEDAKNSGGRTIVVLLWLKSVWISMGSSVHVCQNLHFQFMSWDNFCHLELKLAYNNRKCGMGNLFSDQFGKKSVFFSNISNRFLQIDHAWRICTFLDPFKIFCISLHL